MSGGLADQIRRLQVLWQLLTRVGQAGRVARKISDVVRYRILEVLNSKGVFHYLRDPHTYEETIKAFDFEDNPYTRSVFDVLADPKEGVLTLANGQYQLRVDPPIPTWDAFSRTVPDLALQIPTIQSFAPAVLARMAGQNTQLAQRLDGERDKLLSFDDMLNNRIYDGMRAAAFTWGQDYLRNLEGKTLLDVGCGAGRETAHLWLLTKGQVKITAVDPVQSFVDMAKDRFVYLVAELSDDKHPPITDDNRPIFKTLSAHDLSDLPDESFDYVFYSAMLHWTPDPGQSIGEMLRVLKPGGMIFGNAAYKPMTNRYVDLFLRISPNVYGGFWREELVQWYEEGGATFEESVLAIHRGIKRG